MSGKLEDFVIFSFGVMMLVASLMVFMIVVAFALAFLGHPYLFHLVNDDGSR